jgi:ABC-type transport system involved in multi-copper enzyme maturation permease subunit
MTLEMLANPLAATAPARGWLLATWRLARWDVRLAWRRAMAKVLLGLLLGAYVLVVLFVLLIYAEALAGQVSGASTLRDLLTYPQALALPGYLLRFLGPLVTAILAGALVGAEYGFGTHRLSLSRGMSRAQVLVAQVASLALIALAAAGMVLLLAALVGVTLGPALGSDLIIPLPDGWLQICVYWLALGFNLWAYMLVALFFATLGRSAAAGIGGALGLVLVELVLTFIIAPIIAFIVASENLDGLAQVVSDAPKLLLFNALGALDTYAGLGPITLMSDPTEPLWLALAVVAVFCAGLIGGSYLLFRLRDVTD